MQSLSLISRYIPVFLTLCVGVGLSTIASISMGQWEEETKQQQFQRRGNGLSILLQEGLEEYTQQLLTLRSFHRSSRRFNEEESLLFIEQLMLSHQGILALGWFSKASNNGTLSDKISNNGAKIFKGNYVAIWEKQSTTSGVRFITDSNCQATLAQAKKRRTPFLTNCLEMEGSAHHSLNLAVLMPIYEHSVESTENENLNLPEYVFGIFYLPDVIEELLKNFNYEIDFYVYLQDLEQSFQYGGRYDVKQKRFLPITEELFQQGIQDEISPCESLQVCTRTLNFIGQTWSLTLLPSRTFTATEPVWGAEALLAIGLLLTGSPFVYLSMLMASMDREREIGELKLRLFSLASHEFRTPLSTILLSAQLLEESGCNWTPEKKAKNLQRIQSSAIKMNYLLADLLTLSRAEAGKLEFSPEQVNLPTFCHSLVNEVQSSADKASKIVITAQNLYSDDVYLDPTLLSPILSNLLYNAIKYSPPESMVNFSFSSNAKEITFLIQDSGIGIHINEQLKIYEPFYRGTNTEGFEGTGLGLAVAKTCVDLHKGQIAVSSKVGIGTAFKVTLPSASPQRKEKDLSSMSKLY
jgi:signal transduction histidine kinase